MAAVSEGKRFFYGWVVLGAAFLMMAVVGGGVYYAFGVFVKPMSTELDWSRGTVSIALSIMSVMQAMIGPIIGAVVVRFGARRVTVAGTALLIIGLCLLNKVSEPWHLYLVYGVLCGVAMSCEAGIPVMAMVNNWFIKRRAFAFGITMTGVGVGTFILAPTIRYLIETMGWRSAWLAVAGIASVFALLPALFIIRNKPEDMGQVADGIKPQAGEANAPPVVKKVYNTPVDWEVRAAVKTPTLWLIATLMCANMFTLNMLATHQVAHLEDIGVSPLIAASALGLLVGTSSAGRLTAGALGDRFEPRYLAVLACGLQVIGLVIFINARAVGLIYAYVVVFGVAYGSLLVLGATMLGAYYGRKNFATIQGISFAAPMLIAAISPVLAGFVFDATGSYLIPLIVATIFCGIGGVCAFLSKPPRLSHN